MNTTSILAAITMLTTLFVAVAMARKWWWAPIAGLLNQGPWVAFVLQLDDCWPIMVFAGIYAVTYGLTIPKWYRERPCRNCS